MATEEYLAKFIANGKRYHELPDRFRLSVSEEDWRRRCGGPRHAFRMAWFGAFWLAATALDDAAGGVSGLPS